jgi:uncharacterized DUF497 family protein
MVARFVWDPLKAEANVRKHGISFETAVLAFSDPFAILVQDRIEDGEERWQTLGMAKEWVLLLVAHTIWDADDIEIIRIISARPATAAERRRYEGRTR